MKVLLISLGCDKNLVDSEHMLSLLAKDGFVLTQEETEAEAAIVNTCCFISDAMEESIQTLIDIGRLKETANLRYLIVAGCLAERYADEIKNELPEVDAVVGTNAFGSIAEILHQLEAGEHPRLLRPHDFLPDLSEMGRSLPSGGYYAYLKIAEGCDKRCSYCVIPSIRGPYRSYPLHMLVDETAELARQGVRELILVAQETARYGMDLYHKKSLPKLLSMLSEIEEIRWIRLLYCYPEEIDDALIDAMASNPKVCHYIDMPIQHADDGILRRMGRNTTREDIVTTIGKLRKAIPDICIRTTLICGFPGETQKEHEALLSFVSQQRFDRLGCFTYSRQEGTRAAELPDQVPEEIKRRRMEEIMKAQQKCSEEKQRTFVGQEMEVIVEGILEDEDVYVGRSYRDAPDVDGMVFFSSPYELLSGAFVTVRITASSEYDLIGELL